MDQPLPFQQSEHFYRYLFDSAPDVMMMIDVDGQILVANSRFEEVLGRVPAEVAGQPFESLLPAENRSGFSVMMTGVRDGTALPEAEVGILSRSDRQHRSIKVEALPRCKNWRN